MVSLTNATLTGLIFNRMEELPDLYAHFKPLPNVYMGMSA